MPWITTKSGKRVNTDWFDQERQIEASKAEADIRNNKSSMSIEDFNLESKKWSPIEIKDFEKSISNFQRDFGNIRDLTGPVYRRNLGSGGSHGVTGGEYDRDGERGKGRATYFATSGRATEGKINHEFTHAITEEIASHHKEFGYSSRNEMFKEMRSLFYVHIGEKEPDWIKMFGKNSWASRPEELFSRYMESYDSKMVAFLQMYWKRIGR